MTPKLLCNFPIYIICSINILKILFISIIYFIHFFAKIESSRRKIISLFPVLSHHQAYRSVLGGSLGINYLYISFSKTEVSQPL